MADHQNNTNQLAISMNGDTLFSLNDIHGVTQHIEALKKMETPEDAPELKSIKKTALPDLLGKVQNDVKPWNDIRIGMSKLAADVHGFCSDSLEALEILAETSNTIQEDFETLSDQKKKELQSEMQDIFATLYEDTQNYETNSQEMANKLGDFSKILKNDKLKAEDLEDTYQDYIDRKQEEIVEWEKKHGLKPSTDLVKDFKEKIKKLNSRIEEQNKKYIAATAGASSGGALSLIPVFWVVSVPGCIVGTVFAVKLQNELEDLRSELNDYRAELTKAEKLNTLKIWFDTQAETFKNLIDHLEASQEHVNSLRGQWQTLANELEGLVGDTGKLKSLKKEDWLEPISKFRKLTIARVYEEVKQQTSVFQKLLFNEPEVKVAA